MRHYKAALCARCGRPLEGKFYDPCPHCLREGVVVNYTTVYDLRGATLPDKNAGEGIYRYRELLPLPAGAREISIGEGNTPLRRLRRMGEYLGLDELYMKDESKNPTGSHKDRLASVIVSKALADGAKGVALGSTGNQGAAAAAYSAAAGLPCVIFTTPNVSSPMKTAMQVYGACVFVTSTMDDRAAMVRLLAEEKGFVPASGLVTPPMGSSCFGVDGYKTIAYEVYEQLGGAPDWFVVPISYGDTLYGIYKGMRDLREMGRITRLPHFAAAEVFGAAEASLTEPGDRPVFTPGGPSCQTSIATGYVTYTTMQALRASGGAARTSHDGDALAMQKLLAEKEGVYAELSSVAALVALQKLVRDGRVERSQRVVALITSYGLKDPFSTASVLPEIPAIEPTEGALRRAMEASYQKPL